MHGQVLVSSAVVILSVAAGTASAGAQSTGLVPVRVKVGIFRPENSTTRTFAGSTDLAGEVEVALPKLGAGRTFVSAGYAQGSHNGGKLRVIPLTIGRMFAPPNPASGVTGNVYFGVGAGPYFVKASAGGASTSKTTLGAFGVVGYQLPNPFFVEAKYHIAGKVGGLNPSGLALMIGRRF